LTRGRLQHNMHRKGCAHFGGRGPWARKGNRECRKQNELMLKKSGRGGRARITARSRNQNTRKRAAKIINCPVSRRT